MFPVDLSLLTNLAIACAAIAGALLPSLDVSERPFEDGQTQRDARVQPDDDGQPPFDAHA